MSSWLPYSAKPHIWTVTNTQFNDPPGSYTITVSNTASLVMPESGIAYTILTGTGAGQSGTSVGPVNTNYFDTTDTAPDIGATLTIRF